ncbi:MAG: hypothetical protein IKK43_05390 [Clostridia bacterium]|nr:hypothetical protein [Clostridia bacterium]
MKEKWYKDKEKIYFVAIMMIYIIYASTIVFFHEPWRDEAQAWLIARDTNVIEMFSLSKYEGSPMLWHLLINVLTTLNLPYISMRILHLVLNVCAIFILNKYAPFNKYIKFGITFSHMMAYEYLAIARSYVLVPLLLFLIATIYKERHEKTFAYCSLLLLLQNVCLHTVAIAITLFIIYIIEKIKLKKVDLKTIGIFVIIAVLMGFSIFLLASPVHSEQLYHTSFPKNFEDLFVGAIRALRSIASVVIPFRTAIPIKGILGLSLLIIAVVSLWKDKKVLVVFLISTIVMGGIFAFLNISILLRHAYIYGLVYIFCLWIAKEINVNKLKIILDSFMIALMFIQIIMLVAYSVSEVVADFSNSAEIKELIEEKGYEDYKIFTMHLPYVSSVLTYFPEKTAFALEDYAEHTYVVWNKDFSTTRVISKLDFEYMLCKAMNEYDGKILLMGWEMEEWLDENNMPFEKLYPLSESYTATEEEIFVYKIKDY